MKNSLMRILKTVMAQDTYPSCNHRPRRFQRFTRTKLLQKADPTVCQLHNLAHAVGVKLDRMKVERAAATETEGGSDLALCKAKMRVLKRFQRSVLRMRDSLIRFSLPSEEADAYAAFELTVEWQIIGIKAEHLDQAPTTDNTLRAISDLQTAGIKKVPGTVVPLNRPRR